MTAATPYRAAARLAHGAQSAVVGPWRRAVTASARDRTDASASRPAVVVAPHPDDETLGCGATIARKCRNGTPVTVVIAADGRWAQRGSNVVDASTLAATRSDEARAACSVLGVAEDQVVQLGHEDTHLADVEALVVEQLAEIVRTTRPVEVLVTSRLDHHPDHRVANRAARAALRRAGMKDVAVLEYPVWSWIDGPWRDQAERTPAGRAAHLLAAPLGALLGGTGTKVRTDGFLETKRTALACHASQVSNLTGEDTWAVMGDQVLDLFLGGWEVFLRGRRMGEQR